MAVAMATPKPMDAPNGIRNRAWGAVSSKRGVKPRKVVSDVRKIGRKRPLAPSMTAAFAGAPSRSRWSMKSIITRESFTTTPQRATAPIVDAKLMSIPRIRWPRMAPTTPKGTAAMTISGLTYDSSGIASSA